MPTDQIQTPVRVIVVDDSPLMLKMISSGLRAEGDIDVVAQAKDTREAREMIKKYNPDVVTLDVEMPGMNGLEFLEKIMSLRPMPVIMVSTLTKAGTEVTLSALQIGAVDAVAKPVGRDGLKTFSTELRHKVRMAKSARVSRWIPPTNVASTEKTITHQKLPEVTHAHQRCRLIAIGASTGGVTAIGELLAGIPANMPPIVITQHMPAQFTERFADRLNGRFPLDIKQARHGEFLTPGQVRIAPGDAHLCVVKDGGKLVTNLDYETGRISGHVPSVDVLFNSVCSAAGSLAIGIILTGMGRDGAAGLRAMHNSGAMTFGQSEASCVVYGMPRVAMSLNAVSQELDLHKIPTHICDFLNAPSAKKSA